MNEPDRDLRDRFAGIRREDAAGAPSFHALRAAAGLGTQAHRRMAPIPALAAAAVLALAAILILRPHTPREPLVSLSTTRWVSPTDFLLRVPGAEYLSTVPKLTYRITAIPNWRNP